MHLKTGFSDLKFHLGKGGHVFSVDELVSIHTTGLVQPESHQVHWRLETIGSGKQQTLRDERYIYAQCGVQHCMYI